MTSIEETSVPSVRPMVNPFAMVVLALALAPALEAQTPTRTLSKPDFTLDETFTSVTGLRELSDGRLIIADGREKTLRAFDPRTGSSTAVGREGSGPLEWSMVSRLYAMPGDSTLMEDSFNDRYFLVGPDAKPVGTFRLPDASPAVYARLIGYGGRGQMIFERERSSGEPGPRAGAVGIADILRFDRATQRLDTIGRLDKPKGEVSFARTLSGSQVQLVTNMPLAALDLAVVAPDGRVAIVRGGEYRVDWFQNGRLTRGPAASAPRIRVTQAEREAFLKSQVRTGSIVTRVQGAPASTSGSASPRASGAIVVPPSALEMPDATWPDYKPPFLANGAMSDREGRVWVLRTRAHDDPIPTYDVFDGGGRLVERVVLPKGTRLVGFGVGTVYLARPDEDELLTVERYSLR